MEFDGQHYIVVTGYTSGYLEFQPLSNESVEEVIDKLKDCFAKLGIPKRRPLSDWSKFTSHKFEDFARNWFFDDSMSLPHYQ